MAYPDRLILALFDLEKGIATITAGLCAHLGRHSTVDGIGFANAGAVQGAWRAIVGAAIYLPTPIKPQSSHLVQVMTPRVKGGPVRKRQLLYHKGCAVIVDGMLQPLHPRLKSAAAVLWIKNAGVTSSKALTDNHRAPLRLKSDCGEQQSASTTSLTKTAQATLSAHQDTPFQRHVPAACVAATFVDWLSGNGS